MSKPKRYDPAAIETKWQSRWENEKTYACHVDKDKKKYYVLEMFPYPSGNLHMGHVRNYSIGDVVARFKRMQGFNVMHPMGWDAFGLPAENAAIKHNIHPSVWTHANIDNMRAQLKRLGYSYDWDREVATCDEPYYRWEQLFFLRWLEKGLVYRKKASQNWCPHCNTVLANEQVVDGLCWRCDTPVVQKELTQWFLKITDYADELLADLSKLEGGWPDRVLSMQRNWIGKSVGAEITFPLESGEGDIKVFTTRPDTVFGVTFMTLAPEHPLVESLISGKPNEAEARAFIERTHNMDRIDRQSDSLEKEGVFTGSYCLNPFTGRQVPIWLGNFVLAEYGTGAVMAVPAHDQRDFDFSKKYGMERIVVIQPEGEAPLTPENLTEAYTAPGVLVNSGEFDGLPNEDAKKAIADALEASGKGKRTTNWRLRDWNISRQRYWGEPIPIVHCPKCGAVPVPEDQLPLKLPEVESYQPTGTGESPLAAIDEWVNTTCPCCGAPAKRETNTMPQWAGSSWYFLRYVDNKNDKELVSREKADKYLPVDMYIGGVEHAVLHLLYSRFYTKFLCDIGVIDFDEPFKKLFNQGMITGKNGIKMSKSKGNVVSPDDLVRDYGCDSLRLYELFVGPPELDAEWDDRGIEGVSRFLNRFYNLVMTSKDKDIKETKEMVKLRHKLVFDIEQRFEQFSLNTVISGFMEYNNKLIDLAKKEGGIDKETLKTFTILLAPFAPHLGEELWQELGGTDSVFHASWPECDAEKMKDDEKEVAVQINGRVRATITVPADISKEDAIAAGKEAIKDKLTGNIVKEIYVPGRIVNIVMK